MFVNADAQAFAGCGIEDAAAAPGEEDGGLFSVVEALFVAPSAADLAETLREFALDDERVGVFELGPDEDFEDGIGERRLLRDGCGSMHAWFGSYRR